MELVKVKDSGPFRWGGRRGKVNDRRQEDRKHIFAINGAPEFLNLVRELFQEEGYNVTTTNYVPKSYEQIAALQPDALIVDVVVGQQAGWELLERLHAELETTGIPVWVISTNPSFWRRRKSRPTGMGLTAIWASRSI